MKTLIAYKTVTGASKQYAEWLKEEIGGEIKTFRAVTKGDLEAADRVVVMSGTYLGFMPLNRFLKKNWFVLQNKIVAAIASGAAPADHSWSLRSYKRIPEKIREKIMYWKLPGKEDKKKPNPAGPMVKANLRQVIDELTRLSG